MVYKCLILIIIFIIFIFIIILSSINNNKNNKKFIIVDEKKQLPKDKPYLWFYWEDVNNKKPGYINICINSIYKNCNKTFTIIHLDNNNIDEYLPEIKYNKMNFNSTKIAQKVDFFRILLMYKYGGIYIDVDILVLKDLKPIYDKLKKYDYVGFGCTGLICKYGFNRPSNWLLCSRPNTKLMKNILFRYFDKLNNNNINNYHDLGKLLIWSELDNLSINEGYIYYHYPNLYDGTRDITGKWVSMDRLFSNENIMYDKPNDILFIVLYNSDASETIKNLTTNELLKSDYFISKYFRQTMTNKITI